jgi:uncharacterized protein
MDWLNEPPSWDGGSAKVTITAAGKTDFWRKTHDGGIRDNGHFYYRPVSGDFVAEVRISGVYRDLYDQAGLMVRLDEATWMKCGIEYLHGVQQASAVVTRDYSDWSVVPLPFNPPSMWFRVARHGETFEVSYSPDGRDYLLLRQAYLTDAETLQAGLMVAAPVGEGFGVTFEGFEVRSK